jgi:hypothetical protein
MLTMLCRAHTEQQRHPAPPTERAEVFTRRVSQYRLCLHGLLRDWREERERRTIGDGYVEAVLEVLAPAAYALFAGGHEQFGEGLLREKVRAALGGLGTGHELAGRDATSVIAELKHAGVLVTTGERRAAPLLFLHRTFHEYLAAHELARRAQVKGWQAIAALVDRKACRPAWQEVIVLLAGQLPDPEPLLRLLADQRGDDLFRHRLAVAAVRLTEIRGDARERLVVDRVAAKVVTLWVMHLRKGTEAAVMHLERALSAIGQANGSPAAAPALDRLVELTRIGNWAVRRAAAGALGRIMARDLRILPSPL